jgi:hypothetical protein
MADLRIDQNKLARGIPATNSVTDINLRRILDAIGQTLAYLLKKVDQLANTNASPEGLKKDKSSITPVSSSNLIAGRNITLDVLSNGTRINARSFANGTGPNNGKQYIGANSVRIADTTVDLMNDSDTPGADMVYGTNATGAKAWISATGLPAATEGQILVYTNNKWTAITPILRKVVHTVTYSESTKALTLGWSNMTVISIGTSGGETVFQAEPCP